MNRIKYILSAHKILTLCLAVLMLTTLTFASIKYTKTDRKAEALTGKAMNCFWYQRTVYYNDAAHTTQVGVILFFCDGEIGHSGTTTPYYVIQTCECIEE